MVRPLIGKNIETSDDEPLSSSSSTSSPSPSPSPSPLSSPCLSRKDVEKENGRKRYYIPSSPENETQNQRRTLVPKPINASIPPSSLSPKYHLQKALDNLNQAYIGLKEEEEGKEQVKLLGDYVQSVLVGENPFIKEKERDVLKGLVEEVRALCKEVALKTQTYAEKLKKGLSSSTFAPSSSTTSSSPPPPPYLPLLVLLALPLLEEKKSNYKTGN